MKKDNIFYTERLALNEEYVEKIHSAKDACIYVEKIVSRGQASPDGFWYDQDTDEYVMLIQGNARLTVDGGSVSLNCGDTLFIPAHVRHRVEETSKEPPCIWICVHYKGE